MSINPTSRAEAYKTLIKADASLVELLRAIEEFQGEAWDAQIKIGVSSSITSDLLVTYLQRHGLIHGVDVEVVAGNYDDPVGDMERFRNSGVQQVVLLPFFDNLLPSFESQLGCLEESWLDSKESEWRLRYRAAFEAGRDFGVIYFCSFFRMGSPTGVYESDAVSQALARFNSALREEASAYTNIQVINTEDILKKIGRRAALDTRFYFLSKAPFTGAFMNELASRISHRSRGFGRYFYKVLALDCDNTLWGGVLGEDLVSGIKLGPYDYPGNVFWRIQHEFASLERQGVLLTLVTKNNPSDIHEVFRMHPNMVLREDQFVVKKINWNDKPSNLRELAHDLNVGLDSIVFLDDSAFECEAVRQQLPSVKTFQVPPQLADFPTVVEEIKMLFLAGGISEDSKSKTMQYRQRAEAEALKARFDNREDYLASLELKVELTRNFRAGVPRISELSQKTNQFNLTCRRYSVVEIDRIMDSNSASVYSLVVMDKFGNSGLTGAVILRYESSVAFVENFFMSCRVLGRGIETKIWPSIVADALNRGCIELYTEYVPSAKNSQVADFYDRLGLRLMSEMSDGTRKYAVALPEFVVPENSWIEVTYVE
jgi:FkbH-like protein